MTAVIARWNPAKSLYWQENEGNHSSNQHPEGERGNTALGAEPPKEMRTGR